MKSLLGQTRWWLSLVVALTMYNSSHYLVFPLRSLAAVPSIGKPAFFKAANPPSTAFALENPAFMRFCTARSLSSSSGQLQ